MMFRASDSLALVRLADGDDVFRSLREALAEAGWESAVLLGGIGMLRNAELGFFENGAYLKKLFPEARELAGMQGSVCRASRGKSEIHAHACLADKVHATIAGHLLAAECNVNCEIFLLDSSKLRFYRKLEESGLNGIHLR